MMPKRALAGWVTALACALSPGCTGGSDGPGTADSETISWRLDVATQAEGGFGARLFLDGEQVYLEPSPTRETHRVDVVRPYTRGEHVFEVEIVSSSNKSAVYIASCTAQVNPNGKIVHADGIPWTLGAGERLRLSISL